MSQGDIERLNRMYECVEISSSNELRSVQSEMNSTVISNNATTSEPNVTISSTESLSKPSNESISDVSMDDDSEDMVLTKEQIDSLYNINVAKRNGLKSSFHHWTQGIVPFEIDPQFRKI